MIELEPCRACSRHVKREEARCPFCSVARQSSCTRIPRLVRQRLGRAAQLVAGAHVVVACASAVPAYGGSFQDAGTVQNDAASDAGGDATTGCFSPTQNLDTAYAPGAVGCPCVPSEPDVCVADSTGRLVALTCAFGSWQAVEDGACGGG